MKPARCLIAMITLVALAIPCAAQSKSTNAKRAQRSVAQDAQPLEVYIDHPSMRSAFDTDGYQTNQAGERSRGGVKEVAPAVVRNRIFAQAGIADEVSAWDEVDKDFLFIRARLRDLDTLTAAYPAIDRSKLLKLQELAQGANW